MGIMWEFLEWVGVRRSVGILVLCFVVVSGGVGEGEERRGRLVVVGARQFGDGVSGVGEVVRVDPEEYERLVSEEGVRVVKGAVVSGANSEVLSGSDNETIGSEVRDAGVPDVESLVGSENVSVSDGGGGVTGSVMISTTEVSSSTAGSTSMNPVVVAVNPEDSSRGTGQQGDHGVRYVPGIDRRKVTGKPEGGGGGQDLSFTGILNGLLDSFINDPPPRSQSPRPQSPTPSSPSSEDTSVLEDDEEEEELEDEPTKQSHPSKPSIQSPTPSTTEDISNEQENASEEPIEDDEESSDDYSPSENSTINRPSHTPKACVGECRNILFGLFLCDEIDNDAFCPESGHTCCVNNPEPEYTRYKPYGNSSSEESPVDNEKVPTVTTQESNEDPVEEEEFDEDESPSQQPQSSEDNRKKPPQPQPRPPPQNQPQHTRYPSYGNRPMYNPQSPPPQYYYPPPPKTHNNPPMLMHQPPLRMPLPCPRYCVKNFLDNYCSERLPSQFACGVDGFCCAHDVPMDTIKENQQAEEDEEDERDEQLRNDGLGQGEVDVDEEKSSNKIIGPCTEEVGSCVSTNIINIICFAHAAPTDMYTCPRSSMKCCARKTALPKDSLPSTTTPPPKQENSITRNASSSNYPQRPHQDQPPQGPQILPQFAPPHPHPPPPPHQQYVQNAPFHQQPPPQMAQPTHSPTPPPLAETPPPPLGGIPGTQITNQFSTNTLGGGGRIPPRQPVGQYVCGVKGVPTVSKRRRKKRVVGGSDSLPGEWCWQVALINSLNQYLCGGALIGTQWVLTAAHCVTNIVRSGDAIYVRVGDHDLTSRYGSPGAQTLRVATTYIHHNHNSQTLDNDIALLKLQGNAGLKEGVCLVCLPSRNHMSEIPGKRCTVTGYGYMGESGPIPLRIREANLPIVSDDECVRKVNSVTEKVFALPMSSFCAGGDKSGHDACQGDGGGPLVCRADDPTTGDTGSGYYELTGLVSWGFGCGRENVPGVYVKVSSFIGWIHQIIRSN